MAGRHEPSREAELSPRALPRILCVDDDDRVLRGLGRQLQAHFDVVTSSDPVHALELLEDGEEFSVVLSDLRMPQMNGLDFLSRVSKISPHAARVLLSAYTAPRERGRDDAVFAVLSKPCPAHLLREELASAVSHHARSRQRSSGGYPLHIPPPGKLGFDGFSAAIGSEAPTLERPALPAGEEPKFAVSAGDRLFVLPPGATTLIGRSRACHIRIVDALISRRHASLDCSGDALVLTNLSSTNPARLNGAALLEPCTVRVGDHIEVGLNDLEICAVGPTRPRAQPQYPSLEPTVRLILDDVAARGSRGAGDLATVAAVAQKCLALGHSREAEQILKPALSTLLTSTEMGEHPPSFDVGLAFELALSLAESTRSGGWVNYVFDLSTALGRPLPSLVVDRLYVLVPGTSGTSVASFRAHIARMHARKARLSAGERFTLRRTEGLGALLMISAHK